MIAAGVVEGAGDGRARHAAGVAEAHAGDPAAVFVGGDDAEHVRLIEVEQAEVAIGMILPLAYRNTPETWLASCAGVRSPVKRTSPFVLICWKRAWRKRRSRFGRCSLRRSFHETPGSVMMSTRRAEPS